jgi:UDP-N-acetyl-L-fucosamine synthase
MAREINKMKVMTIVGTRPEIIRLSRVIYCLDQKTQHVLVHTGQNYDYELNEVFFDDLEIRKPDWFLEAAQENAVKTIGQVIIKIDSILEKEKPEAILILGDTNSCLAAIAAKKRKIPIFHMEAGNRCFDQRVPEEANRRVIDHVSDINLPYSDIARSYLIQEGIAPDTIIKTGSPMYEVLCHYREKINNSNILEVLGLKEKDYFLVSSHREENIDSDKNFSNLIGVINEVARVYEKQVIVSTHPRTQKRIEETGAILSAGVETMKPMAFSDYVHLQQHALATLSDSGTITEESSILNFPALNIREAHERPEGMEEASVMMTGLDVKRVLQGLEAVIDQNRGSSRDFSIVGDYTTANVSEKIFRIILSYTDYVNRVVWSKQGD